MIHVVRLVMGICMDEISDDPRVVLQYWLWNRKQSFYAVSLLFLPYNESLRYVKHCSMDTNIDADRSHGVLRPPSHLFPDANNFPPTKSLTLHVTIL